MAKGYKRGNREVKKPKQVKSVPIEVPMFEKGVTSAASILDVSNATELVCCICIRHSALECQ